MARFFNIYVQRFSIGMGPVIIKKEDNSGTEYAISALPLGGYVAMLSEKALQEDDALRDTLTKDQLNNTFESKPRWQRALVMLAGPLANFILSIFIFFFIFSNSLERTFNLNVGEITSAMIIENTQIQSGHVLKSINDKMLSNLQELRLELLSMSGMTGDIFFEDNTSSAETISETAFFGVKFGSINLESKILEKALTEARFFSLRSILISSLHSRLILLVEIFAFSPRFFLIIGKSLFSNALLKT